MSQGQSPHSHLLPIDGAASSHIPPAADQSSFEPRNIWQPGESLDHTVATDYPESDEHISHEAITSTQLPNSFGVSFITSDTVQSSVEGQPPSHEQGPQSLALYESTQQHLYPATRLYDWNVLETDIDLMGIFPQMSGFDYESWLQDFDYVVTQTLPYEETPPLMSGAISMMKDHFQRKLLVASTFTKESQHGWFSAPPDLRMYDKDVINVLLNLAKKHLADAFPVFLPFEFFGGADAELVVAMAAVGALFCDVEGSHKIARACYNDARRIVLAKTISNLDMDLVTLVNRAKIFILLELYGLCSGDGRSFEFVEAFHGFLCQIARKCLLLRCYSPALNAQDPQMKLLFDAIQLLECYRVNLLQRPPTLTMFLFDAVDTKNDAGPDQAHLLASLWTHFGFFPGDTRVTSSSLTSLATVASLVWFPSPHGPFGWREPFLWRTEFVELALHSWKQSQSSEMDPWALVLYHLTHINLHSNTTLLQRRARLVAQTGHITSHAEEIVPIKRWLTSRHHIIARWHAEQLLETVQSTIGIKSWAISRSKAVSQYRGPQSRVGEPPHLPFAVYYASLVLWYGSLAHSRDRLSRNAHIEAGAQMLRHLKVHIARDLSNALYELLI